MLNINENIDSRDSKTEPCDIVAIVLLQLLYTVGSKFNVLFPAC